MKHCKNNKTQQKYLQLVSSMRQSQVHIVSLRWGVWSLNKHLPPSGSIFKVPITGGPGLNAENSLVFTSDFGPVSFLSSSHCIDLNTRIPPSSIILVGIV